MPRRILCSPSTQGSSARAAWARVKRMSCISTLVAILSRTTATIIRREPEATSAAEPVLEHPKLEHDHLERSEMSISWSHERHGCTRSPAIGLHASTDLDAIVGTTLVISLVEIDSSPARQPPLVDYAAPVGPDVERSPRRHIDSQLHG